MYYVPYMYIHKEFPTKNMCFQCSEKPRKYIIGRQMQYVGYSLSKETEKRKRKKIMHLFHHLTYAIRNYGFFSKAFLNTL